MSWMGRIRKAFIRNSRACINKDRKRRHFQLSKRKEKRRLFCLI
jgi:hypothetical protein